MSESSIKDNENHKHQAVGFVSKPFGFNYNFKDVIMYNLGVGASIKDKHGLQWLYEGHEMFGPIPSYAVIPPFAGRSQYHWKSYCKTNCVCVCSLVLPFPCSFHSYLGPSNLLFLN